MAGEYLQLEIWCWYCRIKLRKHRLDPKISRGRKLPQQQQQNQENHMESVCVYLFIWLRWALWTWVCNVANSPKRRECNLPLGYRNFWNCLIIKASSNAPHSVPPSYLLTSVSDPPEDNLPHQYFNTHCSQLSFNHGFDALIYVSVPCGLQCAAAFTTGLRWLLDWSPPVKYRKAQVFFSPPPRWEGKQSSTDPPFAGTVGRRDEGWPGLLDTFCFSSYECCSNDSASRLTSAEKNHIRYWRKERKVHLPCEVMTEMLYPRRREQPIAKGDFHRQGWKWRESWSCCISKTGWITGQNNFTLGGIVRSNNTVLSKFKGIGQGL